MGKKSIVIWGWIFGILLFGTVVSAIIYHFLDCDYIYFHLIRKSGSFFCLIIILLVILESVCIICLTSLSNDENGKSMKKFELLERASFSKNENAEKLAKNEKTEIYKIFCNTLVDL